VSFETWLLFCATETVLCFTPGPAVLLVVSLSLTRGGAAGLGASLGILPGPWPSRWRCSA
jgi:threonine/homoserine/homoserine lactone efflux protein